MGAPTSAEYDAAVAASYTAQSQSGLAVPAGMTLLATSPSSEQSDGYFGAAYQDAQGNVIIVNEGSQTNGTTYANGTMAADAQLLAGQTPKALGDADTFATQVADATSGPVYVTGHSLGGTEAESQAATLIANGVQNFQGGETFGATGLPFNTQAGPQDLTNYVNYGDPVGNFASDPSSPLSAIAPGSMFHYGAVQYLGSAGNDSSLSAIAADASLAFADLPLSAAALITAGVQFLYDINQFHNASNYIGSAPGPLSFSFESLASLLSSYFNANLQAQRSDIKGGLARVAGGARTFAQNLLAAFQRALDDPLVIDVAGTGLNLTPLGGNSPKFDFTGNNNPTFTGWIGAGTGFLAVLGQGGQIAAPNLFGPGAPNGFAALAALDGNNDGVINASDSAFASLGVWQDLNGNGAVDPGEFTTLAQLGVKSISLAATPSDQAINGDLVENTAIATMNDGTTREVADVAFAAPPIAPYSGGAQISPAAAALPELQGYGKLVDLRGQMTADATLLSLAQNLVATAPSSTLAFDGALQQVLYRWAGVDTTGPATRGTCIDAQKLGALEQFTGIPFWAWGTANPRFADQTAVLAGAWDALFGAEKARILVQDSNSPLSTIFQYNVTSDSIQPGSDLTSAIYSVASAAPTSGSAAAAYWVDALGVISDVVASSPTAQLESAIVAQALDSLAPAEFSPSLLAAAANGALTYIDANALEAPISGTDTVFGTNGTDLFSYQAGSGAVEISEGNGGPLTAALVIPGITAGQLTAVQDDGNIVLSDGIQGDQITLDRQLQPGYGVAEVDLGDGTSLTGQQIINLTLIGSSTNKVLYGTAGGDTFDSRGYAYKEVGNGGADTFVYDQNYHQLEIDENENAWGVASTAVLKFGPDIDPSQVIATSDGSGNLYLTDGVNGDTIQLDNALYADPEGALEDGVASVQFANGVTWTRQQLLTLETTATSANERLYGTALADTFDSKGFNGCIEQGNGGADTFLYNPGYGSLEINEGTGFLGVASTAVLKLGAGIDPSQVSVSADAYSNVYLTDGGDRIQLDGQIFVDAEGAFEKGVSAIQFADGTTWTPQQILALELTATSAGQHLYGTSLADTFDSKGYSGCVEQGNGGADTFLYNPGYGSLEVSEGSGFLGVPSTAVLKFGAGIDPGHVSVSTDAYNNAFLTDGVQGDWIQLDGQIFVDAEGAYEKGVSAIQFANGAAWSPQEVASLAANTVASGQTLTLSAGATIGGIKVLGGGTATGPGALTSESYVAGTLSGAAIGAGSGAPGFVEIQSGGSASGVAVQSGQIQIDSGATASAITVNGGGTEVALAGGTASGATVGSGGAEVLWTGGTETNVAVASGGVLDLAGLTVSSGGSFVASVMTAATVTSGVTMASGGVEDVLDATVQSGGILKLASGTVGSGVAVAGGGTEIVKSGGSSVAATVAAGGTETVNAGGVDNDAVLGGAQIVSPLGSAVSAAVLSGGTQTVSSGGIALSTLVSGGGVEILLAGGSANGGSVLSGATDIVWAGATATGVTVQSGGVLDLAGMTISSGANFVASVMTAATVLSGVTVSSGGAESTLDAVVQSGGILKLAAGTVGSATVVSSGGTQVVKSGGLSLGAVVSGGGSETVNIGAADNGCEILSGGTEVLWAGGVETGGAVGSGAVLDLAGMTISSGASLVASVMTAATVVSGATVASGGVEDILNATVQSGGILKLAQGTVGSGISVSSGGTEIVKSGGLSVAAVISGGGTETVNLGGVDGGATLMSGASLTIAAGGTETGALVLSGGVAFDYGAVAAGATVTFVGSGGDLVLEGGSAYAGEIAGFSLSSQEIDLASLAYSSSGETVSWTESSGNTSGTLTVSGGGQTANLTLLGDYVSSNFVLSNDGQGGTAIVDPRPPGGPTRRIWSWQRRGPRDGIVEADLGWSAGARRTAQTDRGGAARSFAQAMSVFGPGGEPPYGITSPVSATFGSTISGLRVATADREHF